MFKISELLKSTEGNLISGQRHREVLGISIDSRTIKKNEAFIAIKGNNYDGHNFVKPAIRKGAGCVIIESRKKLDPRSSILDSRKVALIEVKNTIKALGDIARFQREKYDIPVIGITGSNGKTTTKDMVAWVLSKKSKVLKSEGTKNNQIGMPLTLTNLDNSHRFAVLELGTNHPGEIGYLAKICHPNIGIITNIGSSHLEFLQNLDGVFREKYTLLRYLKRPNICIYNADDRILKAKLSQKNKKLICLGFGIKTKCEFLASNIKIFNGQISFLVNKKYKFTLKVFGYYNIYNALAAITVARIFGMQYSQIRMRLSKFVFPGSRLKLINLGNTRFLDDTYNSNPISLKQALEVLKSLKTKGRKIFVMGDMLELGKQEELFHRNAGRQAVETCDILITVGNLSKLAATIAKKSGKDVFSCESTPEARDVLFKRISPGPEDIILVKGSRLMRMEEIFKSKLK